MINLNGDAMAFKLTDASVEDGKIKFHRSVIRLEFFPQVIVDYLEESKSIEINRLP